MIVKIICKILDKVKLIFAKMLCEITVTPKLHNSESQIGSDGRYFSQVKEIVKIKEKFFNFKRNKIYQVVLEHVTFNEGKKYISFLKKSKFGSLLLSNINSFKINDSIGNPKKFYYKETGLISPTTLRYIACIADIHNIFKRSFFLNTVELGCGYGGFFLCSDIKFNYKKYYLFDHKIVNKLIYKYLKKFKLKKISIKFYQSRIIL